MAHPADNSGVDAQVDEVRAYERQTEATKWQSLLTQAEKDLAALQQEYDDHMATHDVVVKPPPSGATRGQAGLGIQVFPDRLDLSYGKDLAGTMNMLKTLGIKKVRGGIGPATTQTVIDWYNKAYDDLGIKACLTVGKPREPFTTAQWDTLAAKLAKMRGVEILCNWNEPNHLRSGTQQAPLAGWPAMTINHGAELKKRFNADYEIGSAQFWSGNKATHDADLKTIVAATGANGVKYANTFETIVWHLYQSGLDRMKQYETTYFGHFGKRPVICSETGMSTAPNQAQGAQAMTEAGQATYLTQHLTMYLDAGHRVYWFELRDEYDPAGTDREDWLGIFRHDGTAKPAVQALKNLVAQ